VAPQQSARRGRLSALISVSCHDAQTLAIAVTRHRLSFVTLQPGGGHRTELSGSGRSRPVRFDLLAETHLLAPILNILLLHTGHVPSVAGRPFFIVIGLAFVISRVALHFIQ